MATAFTLAALVYFDVVHIWHVLALSVITGLAQAFGGPAYQSLMPSLVEKEHLPNAIAFNSIQFNLARVIGPLLAGAALAAFGMVVVLRPERPVVSRRDCRDPLAAHPPHSGAVARRGCARSCTSGLAFVREHPALIGLSVLGFATTFLGNPLLTFLPLFAQDVFGGGVEQYTQLMACAGAGAVTGALVVGVARQVPAHGTHAARCCSASSAC